MRSTSTSSPNILQTSQTIGHLCYTENSMSTFNFIACPMTNRLTQSRVLEGAARRASGADVLARRDRPATTLFFGGDPRRIPRYQKAGDAMENALLRTASYFKRTGLVAVLYLLFLRHAKVIDSVLSRGPHLPRPSDPLRGPDRRPSRKRAEYL